MIASVSQASRDGAYENRPGLLIGLLFFLASGCAGHEGGASDLLEADTYMLFGSPTERSEFAEWHAALVIDEEPFMTASLDGPPDSEADGWEAQFHARHAQLFFVHVIVTEGNNQGQGFHHIRWDATRTVPWTLGVLGLLLIPLVLFVRRRRR